VCLGVSLTLKLMSAVFGLCIVNVLVIIGVHVEQLFFCFAWACVREKNDGSSKSFPSLLNEDGSALSFCCVV